MNVVAYVPDLMDRSRLSAAAQAVGAEVVSVASPHALATAAAAGADLIVVDLGRPGVLDVFAGLGATPSVGFASHVDTDLLRRAREAGCGTVLARSVFFGRLAETLVRLGGGEQPGPAGPAGAGPVGADGP